MTYTTSLITADRSKPTLDLSVGELLRRAADQAPDLTALIDGTGDRATRGRWTYRELLEQAEAGAAALLERFAPGEHVAIYAPNLPEWTFAQLAAAMAGVVLVTVNPVLRPAEVQYILAQSDAVGVFVADEYRGQNLAEVIEGLRPELPRLRAVIRLARWSEFTTTATTSRDLPQVATDDTVMIQYTSGTTGAPKGAMLRHFGIVNAGHFIAERLERERGDVWLNPLPMFHTGGCVMGTLGTMASLGAQIVVRDFEPGTVLRLIEEEQPVYALGVPTMVMALLEHPDFGSRDTSSLRVFSSGASTVAPELVRRIESNFDVTYNMAMGQTESSSVIFMTQLDSTIEQKAETLGIPLLHWETKIADEAGNPVPIGATGEICCRGWGVMLGYYKMTEATQEAIDADGWLHTGDIGAMDADGYTRITGRLKDMIIRGGENLFPREIEDALLTHPDIADASVIGVPDAKWGEQPVAFVRLSAERRPSDDELSSFLRDRLAAHKVPREWIVVDVFPINAAGKVQKFILREQYDKLHAG
jgi:fatty-acyl-CoA synthase